MGKEESGRECWLLGCDERFGGLRWKEEASVEHAGGCLPPGRAVSTTVMWVAAGKRVGRR